ncbi:ABC transporter ATP-binding protein [Lactococcus fujiensis]|uniref:ABC-type quaternary amine transporter n=1 Tax=Lactococcus fujiensis JCM 16395 TaxID=1291764 RepID=A0A2A5RKW4_9LACT|nr:ABC transporter ATP-binding protein [Lactococcus fujiensis]PCR99860.1 ABC transporter ATPase [Lactococcus fujiensis JCM 16395]
MTITFKNITKDYGGKSVLKDINFTIESREFFVLAGSSGGGKTTLLKMINRLIEPTSGEIEIDGQSINSLNLRDLRLEIGYVLQQIALFPNMTVLENIGLIPQMQGWSKEKIRSRVEELLPLVGLSAEKYLSRYPHELSGGEAQRVGILRALAAEPKIILMDEPFSALDPISRKQLQQLVKKLQEELKITTVFVTHDMSEAMILADHIAIIKTGEIQQIASPKELLAHPANDYVASFFENFQEDLSQINLSDLTGLISDENIAITNNSTVSDAVKALRTYQKANESGEI